MRAKKKKTKATQNRKKGNKRQASYIRRTWGVWLSTAIVVVLFFLVCRSIMNRNVMYDELPPVIDGYEVRGIDVSHHQGKINWDKAGEAKIYNVPVTFAFIKATEGTDMVDPYFHRNISRARKAGVVPGAYHFFSSATSPEKQAELFIRNVVPEYGDLPPVLDVEQAPANKDKRDFQRRVKKWLDIVEKELGVRPLIYTGASFKQEYLADPMFDDYPLWLAHYYVEEMRYKGRWHVWQYTDRGNIDGIKGRVDLNIFNGNQADFELLRYHPE